MFLAALCLIQPHEHRRVLGDFDEHIEPAAGGQTAEQLVLTPHEVSLAYFVDAGCEMPMPEQHHFLLQRPRRFGHTLEPPPAQFDHVLAIGTLNYSESLAAFLLPKLPR